jgi:DNA-binding CsgD family transcriptional regulator/ABC-type sugar transport system substrate-binding protein
MNRQQGETQLSERELAILRLMADGLSNQEIADRLFLALTTVKWYIRQINDKLDTHSRTQTVAKAHQLKLIGDSDTSKVAQAEQHEPPENPYKGLQAFREADVSDFFGRETLAHQLLESLGQSAFLAVVGPSGSGKSSLVNAGLIPALRRGELPDSADWLVAEMLPGSHPLDELEIALLRLADGRQTSLMEHLRRDERGLLRAVRLILPDAPQNLLLVIDQFEELFALVSSARERNLFMNLIHAVVTDPRSPVRVVITLRADFYDRPLLHPVFGDLMERNTRLVLPMKGDEVERAITRPAERVGVKIEPGVASAMIADVNEQPGALPLLQYALTELFDQCQGATLTLEAYRAIGGVTGALARRADTLYEELNHAGKENARQMFLRLVTLGEGVEDTRRRVLQSELLAIGQNPHPPPPSPSGRRGDGEPRYADVSLPQGNFAEVRVTDDLMDEIIQMFAVYRLLTLDYDPATRTPTVELAHEAILREWGRLRVWLDESRADMRLQRLLAHAATEWQKAGGDTSFLLTGSRLAQFEEWAADTSLALTAAERAYLQESVAEKKRQTALETERQSREKRLERRSRTFLRVLVIVLVLTTLGAFGLTGVAVRNEAEARSLALASAAQLALNEGNIDFAIQRAEAALQIGDNELARRVLDQAAFAPRTAGIFQETGGFIPAALTHQQTDLTFAMVAHMGPEFPFGAVIIKGMEDACASLSVSCQWFSDPFLGFDEAYWDDALALNPDGIGTTISDIDNGFEGATERGIPVIVFNVAHGPGDDITAPAFLYIGSDEYVSGQSNARRVFAEARADGVTIQRGVCPNQGPGQPSTDARCAGVASIFDQEGVPLDMISIKTCDGECEDPPEMEAAHLADYFADHLETNAIFMLGPQPAYSLSLYIQQVGLQPRQLYATTHDTSAEIFQMIRDGYLLQTIDQQPYMQGFLTIMSLYLYRQYGIRPSGFINTSSVVDLSNVDSVAELWEIGYR